MGSHGVEAGIAFPSHPQLHRPSSVHWCGREEGDQGLLWTTCRRARIAEPVEGEKVVRKDMERKQKIKCSFSKQLQKNFWLQFWFVFFCWRGRWLAVTNLKLPIHWRIHGQQNVARVVKLWSLPSYPCLLVRVVDVKNCKWG